jgi:hypothetical protein
MKQQFIDDVTGQLIVLVEQGKLTGWSLSATSSKSLQRLYASPDGATLSCHQSRRVEGEALKLSVYTPSTTAGMVGTAMVDLVTYQPLDRQLQAAMELAACSQNKAWKLAGVPAVPPSAVATCDPDVRDRPEDVAKDIESRFAQAFAGTSGCRLNSAELFLNHHAGIVTNSEGLSYAVENSDLYLEAAMEAAAEENDKEVHEQLKAVTAADLGVEEFIEACALQVSVLGKSEEPETHDSATVLVDKEALAQMFEAIVSQLNCMNEYLKLPYLKLGDILGGGAGDALQLDLDPTLPCMALSCAYGIDGLPAKGGALIRDNRVVDRVVGNRFGQYLGQEPNGLCGNIVVAPGGLERAALKGMSYIEILKFSSLLIDARKLTWSSEIKLGRQVAADGTVTLIKGGVASGNLKDNFTHCRLSSSIGTINNPPSSYHPALGYRGPDAMLISCGVSISGKTEGENA